jgi:hypothetical protein
VALLVLDAETGERVAMAILVVTAAPVPRHGAAREGALLSQ